MKNNSEIVLPIVENYRDCFTLIQSDLYRRYEKKISVPKIILRAIFLPFSSIMIWFRLCKHTHGFAYLFARVMFKWVSMVCKIDLPLTTRIGYGFYLGHQICIIVKGGTIIGNNVSVSQFLNIGTNHATPAIIGDNVYIAPMVCLVEDVEIGSYSRVGAGAVVTRDVPERCTVAGVPAKIISQKPNPEWHCWDCGR